MKFSERWTLSSHARYDLNLYPLLAELPPSLPLIQTSSSLLLSLLPSLLATALFRISVFALMFTFLDYWALIPLLLLWLANLVILALLGKPSPRVAPANNQTQPAIGWREEVGGINKKKISLIICKMWQMTLKETFLVTVGLINFCTLGVGV